MIAAMDWASAANCVGADPRVFFPAKSHHIPREAAAPHHPSNGRHRLSSALWTGSSEGSDCDPHD